MAARDFKIFGTTVKALQRAKIDKKEQSIEQMQNHKKQLNEEIKIIENKIEAANKDMAELLKSASTDVKDSRQATKDNSQADHLPKQARCRKHPRSQPEQIEKASGSDGKADPVLSEQNLKDLRGKVAALVEARTTKKTEKTRPGDRHKNTQDRHKDRHSKASKATRAVKQREQRSEVKSTADVPMLAGMEILREEVAAEMAQIEEQSVQLMKQLVALGLWDELTEEELEDVQKCADIEDAEREDAESEDAVSATSGEHEFLEECQVYEAEMAGDYISPQASSSSSRSSYFANVGDVKVMYFLIKKLLKMMDTSCRMRVVAILMQIQATSEPYEAIADAFLVMVHNCNEADAPEDVLSSPSTCSSSSLGSGMDDGN